MPLLSNRHLTQRISQLLLEEKIVVIVTGVLTFALVVDMELSNVADLLHTVIQLSVWN